MRQTGKQWEADRTARQAERRGEREPDLHAQILLNTTTATTDLAIINVGGIAKAVAFELVLPD